VLIEAVTRLDYVVSDEIKSAEASYFLASRPATVQLEQVSWSPVVGQSVLKPIDATVNAGEFVAVVGPNGSGKTSLLRCLYRVNKPTTGRVLLDGEDIWRLPAKQSAKRIATVLQDSGADFGLSVFEMVEVGLTPNSRSWGRSDQDIQLIESALDWLDVLPLAQRDFSSLSGGERQRVRIARALVQQPDVLVLDEPTNHLDIRHQLDVLALIATLPCTVIVSLHDLALASAYADRVMVMKEGRLEAFDTPDNVFSSCRIRQVFDVETVIDKHPITQRPRFSFYLND